MSTHNVFMENWQKFSFSQLSSNTLVWSTEGIAWCCAMVKIIFLHKYLRTRLFEAIVKSNKSRFQTTKTMFKSWDSLLYEHVFFIWKSSRWVEVCMHDVTRQNVAVQNDHLVYAFVDINVVSGNDIYDVRFCKPTPFCTRFNVQKTIILMIFLRYQWDFRLESSKMQE